MKLDFEFVSTHRNRNLWPNPCSFEVPWAGNGQASGLNAVDPVSNQTPLISWIGQPKPMNINATVVSQMNDTVIVSMTSNPLFRVDNYFQGSEFSRPPSFRVDGSKFLSQNAGLDYVQLSVANSGVQPGNSVTIKFTDIPNSIFVPGGSDYDNAYVDDYLYNETRGESTTITGYDAVYHRAIGIIPSAWLATDKYSIRTMLPTVGNFGLGANNTVDTVNLAGAGGSAAPGNFIRVVSTGEISNIVSIDKNVHFATISPHFSTAFPTGTVVEILAQTSDNYRALSYAGTTIGQHEQVAYNVSVVSAIIPNIKIRNGNGGVPSDYPFLYVEFYDTNNPSQNNLFSNNHAFKSYFKITTPTGQMMQRKEQFTKFTGDLSVKTVRFRPTSNFKIVWRLPSCEEIKFEQQDTQSPQIPEDKLQTSILFNLNRT